MKTKPPLVLAITVALASVLGAISAHADTIILAPMDAFRILSIFPTSHDPSLLSVYNNGGDNIQRTILQFDFSSLPAGTTISSATLTLIGNGGPWSQPAGTHSDVYAVG